MSDNQLLRAWEERVISREKGSRIVHYMLRDSIGSSLLAVVGRERSINHMAYVVSEDFLRVFGSTSTVHAGTKWQARREVVEWLISVVSRGGPILANSIDSSTLKRQITRSSKYRQSSTEEVEDSDPEEPATMRASKRIKSCRLNQSRAGLANLVSDNHKVVKSEPADERLNIKRSVKGPAIIKHVVPEPQSSKSDENIELLSQDSGLQGCWFRCKILCSSRNCIKIQYKDVFKVDGPGRLEEWVPATRVAAPDKLGVRCVGRLRIRPQPCDNSSDIAFVVGAAVDAWWCNGWWEGVVIGYDTFAKCNLQVYFPGENRFLTVERRNIRVSRDWINSKWVNIKAKPDILSFLSSLFSIRPKLPVADACSSAPANSKVVEPEQLEESEDDKWQMSITSTSAVEELHVKKRFINKYNEEISHGSG